MAVPARCGLPPTIFDCSGSQCVGYSTLGKKVAGSLQREDSVHNDLLLLWVVFHGRNKTPLLCHENLRNFSSDYLDAKLKHFGYVKLGTVQTATADCGLGSNSRNRRQPNRK